MALDPRAGTARPCVRPICGGTMAFEAAAGRWRCKRCGRVALARAADLLPGPMRDRIERMKTAGLQVVIEGPATAAERFPSDPSGPARCIVRGPGAIEVSAAAATREAAVGEALRRWEASRAASDQAGGEPR
ncbi:MAG: hypothetical protein QOD86_2533 [Miltoncostaeaceae bacterium]|jgi:hypothetical protein|nr:hypothetical protein [Miltoncostaeaceae bacterium]